jgi:hypothetical protein
MDSGIRQLDAAELTAVAGGGVASDLGKIGWGLTGALIGGSVAAAACVGAFVIANAFLDSLSPSSGEGLGQPM